MLKYHFVSIKPQKLIFTLVKFTGGNLFDQGLNIVKTILLINLHPLRYHRPPQLNSSFF